MQWKKAITTVQTELRVFKALRASRASQSSSRSPSSADMAAQGMLANARANRSRYGSMDMARISSRPNVAAGATASPNMQHNPSMTAMAGIGIGLAGYGFIAEPVKLADSHS